MNTYIHAHIRCPIFDLSLTSNRQNSEERKIRLDDGEERKSSVRIYIAIALWFSPYQFRTTEGKRRRRVKRH